MFINLNNQSFYIDADSPSPNEVFPVEVNLPFSENEYSSFHTVDSPYSIQSISFHPSESINCYNLTIISPGQTFYMHASREEIIPYLHNQMHQHDFFEFLFVLDGSVYQNIENSRHLYPKGSCCVLNKNIRHAEEYADTDFHIIFLEIQTDFMQLLYQNLLPDFFGLRYLSNTSNIMRFLQTNLNNANCFDKNYIDFIPTDISNAAFSKIHNIIDTMLKETLWPQKDSSFKIIHSFVSFLMVLESTDYYHTEDVRIGTPTEDLLMNQINALMQEHNGRISRNNLESTLHYSGDYLNKIVKKYTGLNIFNYSMTFCMKKAAELIDNTDKTISQIIVELGFSNRNHFYALFQKNYGVSPKEYRKRKSHPGQHERP